MRMVKLRSPNRMLTGRFDVAVSVHEFARVAERSGASVEEHDFTVSNDLEKVVIGPAMSRADCVRLGERIGMARRGKLLLLEILTTPIVARAD